MRKAERPGFNIYIGCWSVRQWVQFIALVSVVAFLVGFVNQKLEREENSTTVPQVLSPGKVAKTTEVPSRVDFTGKVVEVVDGDTLAVLRNGGRRSIRLSGIDAPELEQPYGPEARRLVRGMVLYERVGIIIRSEDGYGRIVADIVLPTGSILNEQIIEAGLAWWYRDFSNDPRLGELEAIARDQRRGLWRDPDPVSPWQYRRESGARSRLHSSR